MQLGIIYETIDAFSEKSWNDAFASLDELNGINDEVRLYLSWRVPTDVDNRIMGDSVDIDITISLEQAAND